MKLLSTCLVFAIFIQATSVWATRVTPLQTVNVIIPVSSTQPTLSLLEMPNDILAIIFGFLTPQERRSAALACRYLNNLNQITELGGESLNRDMAYIAQRFQNAPIPPTVPPPPAHTMGYTTPDVISYRLIIFTLVWFVVSMAVLQPTLNHAVANTWIEQDTAWAIEFPLVFGVPLVPFIVALKRLLAPCCAREQRLRMYQKTLRTYRLAQQRHDAQNQQFNQLVPVLFDRLLKVAITFANRIPVQMLETFLATTLSPLLDTVYQRSPQLLQVMSKEAFLQAVRDSTVPIRAPARLTTE